MRTYSAASFSTPPSVTISQKSAQNYYKFLTYKTFLHFSTIFFRFFSIVHRLQVVRVWIFWIDFENFLGELWEFLEWTLRIFWSLYEFAYLFGVIRTADSPKRISNKRKCYQKRKHLQARCILWLVAALCTKVAQTAVCHVFSVSRRYRQVSALWLLSRCKDTTKKGVCQEHFKKSTFLCQVDGLFGPG